MELELSQLILRYEHLRIPAGKRLGGLVASLMTHGQLQAVLVVEDREGGLVLVDGYRRVRALRKLGQDVVDAIVLPLDEPGGLVFQHRLGSDARRSQLEDGWLVHELKSRHGMSLSAIAVALERSKS